MKNIWTCYRNRMLENKKEQRVKGHNATGRYCNNYTLPPTKKNVERKENHRKPKQIATATMEGTTKKGKDGEMKYKGT
jgi:hypothetical protein